MIPITQDDKHGCMMACIASLLNLQLSDLPVLTFDKPMLPGDNYPAWYVEVQSWLARRNLAWIEVELKNQLWKALPYPIYVILIGPRPNGTRHSIVGKAEHGQFIPLWDPLGTDPNESFRDGIILSVVVLASIDPSVLQRMGSALEKIEDSSASEAIRSEARRGLGRVHLEMNGFEL